jgi:hypothetical protein
MKKAITLGLAALLGLAGCSEELGETKPTKSSISGIPLSSATASQYGYDYFAGIFKVDGKTVLARTRNTHTSRVAEAQALVNMEINDGDNEAVQLTGHYENDRFFITSLESNGYTINF